MFKRNCELEAMGYKMQAAGRDFQSRAAGIPVGTVVGEGGAGGGGGAADDGALANGAAVRGYPVDIVESLKTVSGPSRATPGFFASFSDRMTTQQLNVDQADAGKPPQ